MSLQPISFSEKAALSFVRTAVEQNVLVQVHIMPCNNPAGGFKNLNEF